MVYIQTVLFVGAGGAVGIYLFVQLCEQSLLQRHVVVEVVDSMAHHVFGKLFSEYLRVPGLQGRGCTTRRDVHHQ